MVPVLKSKIAIIGGGPAGCICAYYLKENGINSVIFECKSPLKTLLPTGGGRCNLAHAEYDFRELAKNYPRGEKFLYSVFSKFATAETIEFFEDIGVETYTQEDMRMFPTSNSAVEVREKMLKAIAGVKILNEKIHSIEPVEGGYKISSDKDSYVFEKVVISVGGHSKTLEMIKNLGHKITASNPALTGLKTQENLSPLAGVVIKNAKAIFKNQSLRGDVLFTHVGVSGPLVFMISSLMACENFPYSIKFDFAGEIDLQVVLNSNPRKSVKNLLSEFVPKSYGLYVLAQIKIEADLECSKINGKMRDAILRYLNDFEITVKSPSGDGEVVTCGGVALDEVNPKTMESKIAKGVYFCGEVLDIDGFCGGFNLQNCWSTGYLSAMGLIDA